jgi:uncharacterized protein
MENTQPAQSPIPQDPVQPQKPRVAMPKRTLLVVGIALFVVAVGIGSFFFMQDSSAEPGIQPRIAKKVGQVLEKQLPTPLPFREMTVPFLREREYKSNLSELEPAYNGANYTAYLTSYDSDGFKVNGLVTIPAGDQPEGGWPAIVFIHGYIPPTLYETNGEAYSSYIDFLAGNGFVVFKIDLRGHGDSEGEAGGGYYGSDYVVDALNARAALQASDFVNPEKIGLWGHSMAGNVSMRAFAARPEIPAVVIWGGAVYSYVDMQKYGIQDNSYRPPNPTGNTQRANRRRELFEKHGSPSAQSVFWQQVAPIYYLDDLKGAISLHHAVDDDVVNIGYSRDLNALLDKTSVEHEMNEYASGGHNISGSSFNEAMQRTVAFYKKYLD